MRAFSDTKKPTGFPRDLDLKKIDQFAEGTPKKNV